MTGLSTGRFALLGAALTMAASMTMISDTAQAWKPTTHVYFAERALDDAKDGKVTISSVDYETGKVTGTVGTYSVDSKILAAIRKFPSHFRAGVLGPDAYPDILSGQQSIHPDEKGSGVKGGSNTWLQYMWDRRDPARLPGYAQAMKARKIPNDGRMIAFTAGFLTHAAGDMYGHTFINNFAGGPFAFNPPSNATKHVLLEGYIDKRLPKQELGGDFFGASISGLDWLIYKFMVDARPGTVLDKTLLRKGAAGTTYSIPRIFSTVRANLQRDINKYRSTVKNYDKKIKACKLTDFSCSKAILTTKKGAYIATNGIQQAYRNAWIKDVDTGLRKWPAVSHRIAIALFFNKARKADVDKAEAIMKAYARDHILSMAGAPDFVGATAKVIGKVVDAITPKALQAAIKKLKDKAFDTMLQAAIGMNKAELKKLMTNPQNYFNSVMGSGGGEKISLANFNAKYLKIADKGYTNPREAFDYRKFTAGHNTVQISKMILMSPSEVRRMLRDIGSKSTATGSNIMLGFMRTLDGNVQWRNGMPAARDCVAYRKIFMKQAGDDGRCSGIKPKPTPVVGKLPPPRWVTAKSGRLPRGAYVGGQEPGRKLYVCRAAYKKGVHPGKVVAGKCNIGWGGKERALKSFQVLVANSKSFRFVNSKQGARLPKGTFIGGKEPGRTLPVCRASHRGGWHPGKIVAGKCNIGWGGKEIARTRYQVLVRAQ